MKSERLYEDRRGPYEDKARRCWLVLYRARYEARACGDTTTMARRVRTIMVGMYQMRRDT